MGRSSSIPSGLPVGSVVQGINLSEPEYVPCDGRPGAGQAMRGWPSCSRSASSQAPCVRWRSPPAATASLPAPPTWWPLRPRGAARCSIPPMASPWSKAGVATPYT